jgi:hypothetical protein
MGMYAITGSATGIGAALRTLLEKQGHPTGTFDSSIMARNWLFAQVWSWPMVLTVLSH